MNVTITKHLFAKAVELALVCALLSFLFHSSMGEEEDAFLASGTFLGYLIIITGLILGEILNTPVDVKVDVFYTLVGGALFVTVGLIFVQEPYRSISKKEKIKGYTSIVTGVILFADTIAIILQEMIVPINNTDEIGSFYRKI